MAEAEKRQDAYLMTHAVSDMVLFPYHKWFMTELRRAPQKPDNLIERIDTLLADW